MHRRTNSGSSKSIPQQQRRRQRECERSDLLHSSLSLSLEHPLNGSSRDTLVGLSRMKQRWAAAVDATSVTVNATSSRIRHLEDEELLAFLDGSGNDTTGVSFNRFAPADPPLAVPSSWASFGETRLLPGPFEEADDDAALHACSWVSNLSTLPNTSSAIVQAREVKSRAWDGVGPPLLDVQRRDASPKQRAASALETNRRFDSSDGGVRPGKLRTEVHRVRHHEGPEAPIETQGQCGGGTSTSSRPKPFSIDVPCDRTAEAQKGNSIAVTNLLQRVASAGRCSNRTAPAQAAAEQRQPLKPPADASSSPPGALPLAGTSTVSEGGSRTCSSSSPVPEATPSANVPAARVRSSAQRKKGTQEGATSPRNNASDSFVIEQGSAYDVQAFSSVVRGRRAHGGVASSAHSGEPQRSNSATNQDSRAAGVVDDLDVCDLDVGEGSHPPRSLAQAVQTPVASCGAGTGVLRMDTSPLELLRVAKESEAPLLVKTISRALTPLDAIEAMHLAMVHSHPPSDVTCRVGHSSGGSQHGRGGSASPSDSETIHLRAGALAPIQRNPKRVRSPSVRHQVHLRGSGGPQDASRGEPPPPPPLPQDEEGPHNKEDSAPFSPDSGRRHTPSESVESASCPASAADRPMVVVPHVNMHLLDIHNNSAHISAPAAVSPGRRMSVQHGPQRSPRLSVSQQQSLVSPRNASIVEQIMQLSARRESAASANEPPSLPDNPVYRTTRICTLPLVIPARVEPHSTSMDTMAMARQVQRAYENANRPASMDAMEDITAEFHRDLRRHGGTVPSVFQSIPLVVVCAASVALTDRLAGILFPADASGNDESVVGEEPPSFGPLTNAVTAVHCRQGADDETASSTIFNDTGAETSWPLLGSTHLTTSDEVPGTDKLARMVTLPFLDRGVSVQDVANSEATGHQQQQQVQATEIRPVADLLRSSNMVRSDQSPLCVPEVHEPLTIARVRQLDDHRSGSTSRELKGDQQSATTFNSASDAADVARTAAAVHAVPASTVAVGSAVMAGAPVSKAATLASSGATPTTTSAAAVGVDAVGLVLPAFTLTEPSVGCFSPVGDYVSPPELDDPPSSPQAEQVRCAPTPEIRCISPSQERNGQRIGEEDHRTQQQRNLPEVSKTAKRQSIPSLKIRNEWSSPTVQDDDESDGDELFVCSRNNGSAHPLPEPREDFLQRGQSGDAPPRVTPRRSSNAGGASRTPRRSSISPVGAQPANHAQAPPRRSSVSSSATSHVSPRPSSTAKPRPVGGPLQEAAAAAAASSAVGCSTKSATRRTSAPLTPLGGEESPVTMNSASATTSVVDDGTSSLPSFSPPPMALTPPAADIAAPPSSSSKAHRKAKPQRSPRGGSAGGGSRSVSPAPSGARRVSLGKPRAKTLAKNVERATAEATAEDGELNLFNIDREDDDESSSESGDGDLPLGGASVGSDPVSTSPPQGGGGSLLNTPGLPSLSRATPQAKGKHVGNAKKGTKSPRLGDKLDAIPTPRASRGSGGKSPRATSHRGGRSPHASHDTAASKAQADEERLDSENTVKVQQMSDSDADDEENIGPLQPSLDPVESIFVSQRSKSIEEDESKRHLRRSIIKRLAGVLQRDMRTAAMHILAKSGACVPSTSVPTSSPIDISTPAPGGIASSAVAPSLDDTASTLSVAVGGSSAASPLVPAKSPRRAPSPLAGDRGGSSEREFRAPPKIRVAVVISIATYKDTRVSRNHQCEYEATAVAATLASMGFAVTRMSMYSNQEDLRPTSRDAVLSCIKAATRQCRVGADFASIVYICGGGYSGPLPGSNNSNNPQPVNLRQAAKPLVEHLPSTGCAFAVVPGDLTLSLVARDTVLTLSDLQVIPSCSDGTSNWVIIDTYSASFLPPCPSNLNGFGMVGGRKTIGGELFCLYELQHMFPLSLYFMRAISGWATRDSRLSVNAINAYVHGHLTRRGLFATTTASPFFVGDLDLATVHELRFCRQQVKDIRNVLHGKYTTVALNLIPTKNQDPTSAEFVRCLRDAFVELLASDASNPLVRCLHRVYEPKIYAIMRGVNPVKFLADDAALFRHTQSAIRELREKLHDPSVEYRVQCVGSLLLGEITVSNAYARDAFLLTLENSKRIRLVKELKKAWVIKVHEMREKRRLLHEQQEAALKQLEEPPQLTGVEEPAGIHPTVAGDGDNNTTPAAAQIQQRTTPSTPCTTPRPAGNAVQRGSITNSTTASGPRTLSADSSEHVPRVIMTSGNMFNINAAIQQASLQQAKPDVSRAAGFYASPIDAGFTIDGRTVHELGLNCCITFLTTEFLAMKLDRAIRSHGLLSQDFIVRDVKITAMDEDHVQLHLLIAGLQSIWRGRVTRRKMSVLLPVAREEVTRREKIAKEERDFLMKINAALVWSAQRIMLDAERTARGDLRDLEHQALTYMYMDRISLYQRVAYHWFVSIAAKVEMQELLFREEIVWRKNILWPGILRLIFLRKYIRILRDENKVRLKNEEQAESKLRNVASQFWKVERKKW